MADDEDLKLNSLSRYRKQSPRMVLEVHSHCEIPAGCGGVVLRWTGRDGMEATVLAWCRESEVEVFLDGHEVPRAGFRLTTGAHVLALRVRGLPSADRRLALTLNQKVSEVVAPGSERRLAVRTVGDGSWRVSSGPLPEAWADLDFDDASWSVLEEPSPGFLEKISQALQQPAPRDWPRTAVLEGGGRELVLPDGPDELMVRHRFVFDGEG